MPVGDRGTHAEGEPATNRSRVGAGGADAGVAGGDGGGAIDEDLVGLRGGVVDLDDPNDLGRSVAIDGGSTHDGTLHL